MSTHQILMELMSKIGVTNNFIEFILVVLLEIPIIFIINNYFPYILGKNKIKQTKMETDLIS